MRYILIIYIISKVKINKEKLDFFNLNIKKKPKYKSSFKEEDALNKILYFLIENNLSFNALSSQSFQSLLSYYNK